MSKFANQVPSHTPVKKEAYDLKVENMHDVAKIFNRTEAQIQIPFDQLCINELNLAYKNKGYPYLYTQAKVSMALYLRWKALKEGTEKPEFTKSSSYVEKEQG